MDITTIIVVSLTAVISGLFAQWSKRRISDSPPDSEELGSQRLYIQSCLELINGARNEVLIRTSMMSRSLNLIEAGAINQAIQNARKKGVIVRILVASAYDRLPGAIELEQTIGADVRFDPEIPMSDINYYCVDGLHVVIATREKLSELQHRRSTSWTEFRSTFLASVLSREFERRWQAINTRRLREYMKEVLPAAIETQGIGAVSDYLDQAPAEIEKYRRPIPSILFIIGRPGSGKTTIARLIREKLTLTRIYPRIIMLSDLDYLKKVFGEKAGPKRRFEKTDDGGFFILDETLYDEALLDLSSRVLEASLHNDLLIVEFSRKHYIDALERMAEQGLKANVVAYIDVIFKTALERNKVRSFRFSGDAHFVSEKEMHATYAVDDLAKLQKLPQFNTIVIDNGQDVTTGLEDRVLSIIEKVKEANR